MSVSLIYGVNLDKPQIKEHPTLVLVHRKHLSTIRQDNFFETFHCLNENSTNLHGTCSALLNLLRELTYRIPIGLVERQLSYNIEKFSVSTITTCLLSGKST